MYNCIYNFCHAYFWGADNNKLLELETKSTRGYFIPKHKMHDDIE